MNPHYLFVATRAGHRCEYCRAPEAAFNFAHEVEHIVPRSQAGTEDENNLALACRACNLFKAGFLTGRSDDAGDPIRLFNPRTDAWTEHFVFNLNSLEIEGPSPIGRATAERLQFNRRSQIAARRHWMAFGLFP